MTITFHATNHSYRDEKGLLPSVTTIIGASEPAGGLPMWYAKQAAARAISERANLANIDPDNVEDMARAAAFIANAGNEERDKAGAWGTGVHEWCHNWITKENQDPVLATEPPRGSSEKHAVSYLIRLFTEQKITATGSEFLVTDLKRRYAGTADLRIRFGTNKTEYVADIKTSASGYQNPSGGYGKLAQQLAAYAYAPYYVDADGEPEQAVKVSSSYGYGILLRPEGVKLVKIDIKEGWKQFQRSLETYAWGKKPSRLGEMLVLC